MYDPLYDAVTFLIFLRYMSRCRLYLTKPFSTFNLSGFAVLLKLPSSRNVLPLSLNTRFPPFTRLPYSSVILAIKVMFSPIIPLAG